MSEALKAVVYVAWDEAGAYSAHVDAHEAADDLEGKSEGKFRRVVEMHLSLPSAGPMAMNLTVQECAERPSVSK